MAIVDVSQCPKKSKCTEMHLRGETDCLTRNRKGQDT